jgi:hypothetical protein
MKLKLMAMGYTEKQVLQFGELKNPLPFTLYPLPFTLIPKPLTLNSKPFTLYPLP